MQIILQKDVPKVGRKGDVAIVADGYAQNALIAKGLAERATPEKLAALRTQKERSQEIEAAQDSKVLERLGKLAGTQVSLGAKVNEQGHLYQKIGEDVVRAAIEKAAGGTLAGVDLKGDFPIKEAGEHALVLMYKENAAAVSCIVKST